MFRSIALLQFLCLLGALNPAYSQTVYISEFMASNQDTLDDEDGESSDWIELFNSGSTPVDLDGWYLSDDAARLTKWQIPDVTLGGGQFLNIFASTPFLPHVFRQTRVSATFPPKANS